MFNLKKKKGKIERDNKRIKLILRQYEKREQKASTSIFCCRKMWM